MIDVKDIEQQVMKWAPMLDGLKSDSQIAFLANLFEKIDRRYGKDLSPEIANEKRELIPAVRSFMDSYNNCWRERFLLPVEFEDYARRHNLDVIERDHRTIRFNATSDEFEKEIKLLYENVFGDLDHLETEITFNMDVADPMMVGEALENLIESAGVKSVNDYLISCNLKNLQVLRQYYCYEYRNTFNADRKHIGSFHGAMFRGVPVYKNNNQRHIIFTKRLPRITIEDIWHVNNCKQLDFLVGYEDLRDQTRIIGTEYGM